METYHKMQPVGEWLWKRNEPLSSFPRFLKVLSLAFILIQLDYIGLANPYMNLIAVAVSGVGLIMLILAFIFMPLVDKPMG